MKHQKPRYDPGERVFTLFDIQRFWSSQKKKILKASWIGALLGFGCFLIASSPKYQIHATFKEAANISVNGIGSLEKLAGSFGGASSSESQIITVIQSYPVLKPLVERMGAQIVVSKRGRLSAVYRRIRDNILAERKMRLSDIDWFAFRDIVYSGDRPIHYSLRFEDPEHFSILSGKKIIASGSLGSSVSLPEAQLTLMKVPGNLRLRFDYPFSILPWVDAVRSIRSNFKVAAVKNHKSIFDLYFTNRDRYFGTELLNVWMAEYRNYLQRDHDELVKEQLAYLQKKQEEICGQMFSVFDEYTRYLQSNLTHSGLLNVRQEIDGIAHEYKTLENKAMVIDLELERLNQGESDPKAFIAIEANSSYLVPQQIIQLISELKQQRDLIELSFPNKDHAFNEAEYESRKEELKGIRERLSGVQSLLNGADKDALLQKALFDPERFLETWAARLDHSQTEEREDLAEYLENYIRFLSMQEKIAQEQIFYGKDIPSEFRGIDLTTARELFKEYNSKLDQSAQFLGHFDRLGEEIKESDFEISSLCAVLSDPLSQRLIAQASEIVLKLKDETHRSEKEGGRWAEELSLQKKILKDHLDQLAKVEKLKSQMIQDKIAALQTLSIGCISGEITVLQKRLSDWIKNRKMTLKSELRILKEKIEEVRKGFSSLPEKWHREEWLNLRKEMGVKMVQSLTDLVESKTISSHLHHVESKPLNLAIVPSLPCHPGLLIKAFLGAFLAGFAVFFRLFFQRVLKGFPLSRENLRAMRYPVLGAISPFCDGPAADPLSGSDLETLRQISLFLDTSPKGKVVGIIEGKGPDYSYALAEHFARTSLRTLVVRCDFNVKFRPQDLPGLLQIWKQESSDPFIRRRQGYDYLTSGGHTPYGAEVIRSHHFQELLERFKKDYDFVLLVFRSPLNCVESLSPLSLCDRAIVTVLGEPTEQLTPFIDWAYHEDMCRLVILTADLPL